MKLGGVLFGIILIAFAVGAYYSGEPAAQTDIGKIAILFVAIQGVFIIIRNLSSGKKKVVLKQEQVLTPEPVSVPLCPSCGKQISSDYAVCPYCGKHLIEKCHSCGKNVSDDFLVCPYCEVSLKKERNVDSSLDV